MKMADGFLKLHCILVFFFLAAGQLAAQTETAIFPADGEENEGFGGSVDGYGDFLLVGAANNDTYGTSAGKAYLFKNMDGQWTEQAELFGHDLQTYDYFGWRVALGSGVAFIGAMTNQRDSANAGAVYIFDRIGDSWLQHSRLTAPNQPPSGYFGNALAFDGGFLAVGAYGVDDWSGRVYIYEKDGSGWVLRQTLQPADNERRDFFGRSLAMTQDRLVIGAEGDDDAGENAGAVYVYRLVSGEWTEWKKVLPSDPAAELRFGRAVDVRYFSSGPLRLAVSSNFPAQGEQAGRVIVYREESEFVREGDLHSRAGQQIDRFGYDLALGENFLAVGAEHFCAWHEYQGAAYLYRQAGSSWYECGDFVDRQPVTMGLYGVSVAMGEDFLFVGKYHTDLGNGAGLVMAYRLNTAPVISACADIPHDQGAAVQIDWDASFLDIGQKITKYSVWRALPGDAVAKAAGSRIRSTVISGRTFNWEWVADQPAHHYASYMAAAPTLYDSLSTTPGWHYFLVSAHHPDGTTFIDSEIDSAYSVDNLAPPPPADLNGEAVENQVILRWKASPAPDVAGYRVYWNGIFQDFTEQTSWQQAVPAGEDGAVCAVSTVDIHENEGLRCPEIALTFTDVDQRLSALPGNLSLLPNYPNPFNPQTTLSFDIPGTGQVRLSILDVRGRELAVVLNERMAAGRHAVVFNAGQLSSGVYTCRLQWGGLVRHQKILYIQ